MHFRLLLAVVLLLAHVALAEDSKPPADLGPLPPPPADSGVWVGHILREKKAESRITELVFEPQKFPVVLVPQDGGMRPLVEIRGRYARPGWTLMMSDSKPVPITSVIGDFKVPAYLNARISDVTFLAKGPKGEIEKERVFIYAPKAQEFKAVKPLDALFFGIGSSYMVYRQTGYGEFKSITGLLTARIQSPERESSRFAYLAAADVTVFTLASTPIERGPQIVDAKADVSYRLTKEPGKIWNFQALAGLHYLTMIPNGSPFGFKNLAAFELGLRARKVTSPKTAWVGEFRYVPLDGFGDFERSGFDGYVSWNRILDNLHRIELGLAVSQFSNQPDASTAYEIGLISLKAGISL